MPAEEIIMTMKIFARRDSATALLRKMGIKSEDYNKFIDKNADGTVGVDVIGAKASLAPKLAGKATVVPPSKTGSVILRPQPGQTTTSYIRSLITAGHTNSEIWQACQEFLGFEKNKSYYPAWNRSKMRKAGFDV
jgi:hypothetical protein